MMDLVCTWDGKYFGWIDSGGLFTADGRHVGEFRKENIFSENGLYLGELMQGRLITDSLKKETHTSLGFWPTATLMRPRTIDRLTKHRARCRRDTKLSRRLLQKLSSAMTT